ncbi:related to ketoreductases [Fusarium fujikuroi]|nr:related to ketoreductases [Fusarium fujikuroi]
MRQQKSGHIIQVSSIGGRIGTPGAAAYQSAQWAVGGFSTVLSKELASFGIKVTVAEPTGINNNMGVTATDNSKEYSGWTEVSEIARAIIHLSNAEDPPLRIVLGKDALQKAEMVAKTLAESDEKWTKVSKLEF